MPCRPSRYCFEAQHCRAPHCHRRRAAHLVDHLPGAQRIVAHLRVAHVRVAGQPYRRAVRAHRPDKSNSIQGSFQEFQLGVPSVEGWATFRRGRMHCRPALGAATVEPQAPAGLRLAPGLLSVLPQSSVSAAVNEAPECSGNGVRPDAPEPFLVLAQRVVHRRLRHVDAVPLVLRVEAEAVQDAHLRRDRVQFVSSTMTRRCPALTHRAGCRPCIHASARPPCVCISCCRPAVEDGVVCCSCMTDAVTICRWNPMSGARH